MLVLNAIFERTWGGVAGSKPDNDYWTTVIPAIKSRHPEFRFIAEAYWDLEWELQQQGFDFCYDKKLYDRMEHGPAESARQHLLADLSYQEGMVRFIENHDEPRAAATFAGGRDRAAAVAILTLPGPGCCTRASSRDGAYGCRSSWADARRRPSITISQPSTDAFSKPPIVISSGTACGAFASAAGGPTTRVARTFSPGAG